MIIKLCYWAHKNIRCDNIERSYKKPQVWKVSSYQLQLNCYIFRTFNIIPTVTTKEIFKYPRKVSQWVKVLPSRPYTVSLVHGFHAHGEGGRVFVSCPLTSTGAPWHRHLPPSTNKCDFKSLKKKSLRCIPKK